jgi:hypothetical protein
LAAAAFGFVLALGTDVAPFSTLVADPVRRERVAWTEVIMFDLGNTRVFAVELFFIMKGAHEVFNVSDFGVAVPDECTNALLFVSEGSFAWVTSVHGGVVVNADADAVACERRRGTEGIDSRI